MRVKREETVLGIRESWTRWYVAVWGPCHVMHTMMTRTLDNLLPWPSHVHMQCSRVRHSQPCTHCSGAQLFRATVRAPPCVQNIAGVKRYLKWVEDHITTTNVAVGSVGWGMPPCGS